MTQDVQIHCINKIPRNDPYHRITHVGGINAGASTRWRLTLDEAIKGAKEKKWHFWTVANGKSVWVEVHKTAQGHEYLKTDSDGDEPNNLLSLPECPTG